MRRRRRSAAAQRIAEKIRGDYAKASEAIREQMRALADDFPAERLLRVLTAIAVFDYDAEGLVTILGGDRDAAAVLYDSGLIEPSSFPFAGGEVFDLSQQGVEVLEYLKAEESSEAQSLAEIPEFGEDHED